MITAIIPASRDAERVQMIVDRLHTTNKSELAILVSSPSFKIDGAHNVRDDMVGSARAIAHAFDQVPSCDFVAWLSDICIPLDGCMDKMATFLKTKPEPFIAEFRTVPYVEGRYRVCTIKGRQYARWGMMSMSSVVLCGGFFDAAFKDYYGDVDLSLRCWKNSGAVETCVDAVVEIRGHAHINNAPSSNDEGIFIDRWKEDYPAMITEHTSEWNIDKEWSLK